MELIFGIVGKFITDANWYASDYAGLLIRFEQLFGI